MKQTACFNEICCWVDIHFFSRHKAVLEMMTENGYAIVDLVRELHAFSSRLELSNTQRIFLLENLADVEYRLTGSASEKVQLAGLVAVFQVCWSSSQSISLGIFFFAAREGGGCCRVVIKNLCIRIDLPLLSSDLLTPAPKI